MPSTTGLPSKDKTSEALLTELLENILARSGDLRLCGDYCTSRFRDLSGARVVALLKAAGAGTASAYAISSVAPQQARDAISHPHLTELARLSETAISPVFSDQPHTLASEPPPLGRCLVVPLRPGGEHTGALLLLDLPESETLAATVDLLDRIADLIGLIFQHAAFHSGLEYQVAARTAHLEQEIAEHRKTETAIERRLASLTQPLEATDDLSLEDLFDLGEIQRLQDDFSLATGVASIITRTDGTPITGPSNFCRLCRDIIRQTEQGLANCRRSDATLGTLSTLGPVVRPCLSAGLWDAGAGISIDGRHIANWLIGQVRDETQTEEQIRRYARQIGADEETMAAAFAEVPAMARHRFEAIARMLFTLAAQLSTAAYHNLQQARFIHARSRAEEALKASELRLRAIYDTLPQALFLWQRQGSDFVLAEVNPAAIELYRMAIVRQLGSPLASVHRNEPELIDAIDRCLDEERGSRIKEHRFPDLGASERYFDLSLVPIPPDRVMVMAEEVTEQRQLRAERERLDNQRHQLVKAESLRCMAGAIAHHYNNQLNVVMGNIELVMETMGNHTGVRRNLIHAMHAARRSAEISGLLLTYLGHTAVKKDPLDLAEVCRHHLPTLQERTPARIAFTAELPAAGPVVLAGAHQLVQVLNHLVTNALEAMAEHEGTVTVAVSIVAAGDIPPAHLMPTGWRPAVERYACLSVADTGCGMNEEDMDRMFDPFFTTKFTGRGLGLPVTLGLVKVWDGAIGVESRPGLGTIVHVYLPLVSESAWEKTEEPSDGAAERGLTVLLVEDEKMVRNLARAMLEHLGYEVVTAASGAEAIETYRLQPHRIQLALSDLIMPGMDGWETLTALRQINPALPVILVSGHEEALDRGDAREEQPQAILHKPYTLDDLRRVLLRALRTRDTD